jgi:hypothetical protein
VAEVQPITHHDVPEKPETEGLQKQEEELGILEYLVQLKQVTARFLSRLVLL